MERKINKGEEEEDGKEIVRKGKYPITKNDQQKYKKITTMVTRKISSPLSFLSVHHFPAIIHFPALFHSSFPPTSARRNTTHNSHHHHHSLPSAAAAAIAAHSMTAKTTRAKRNACIAVYQSASQRRPSRLWDKELMAAISLAAKVEIQD